MAELSLIPCKSFEALAERLNADLEEGRALRFHNNSGIFVKDNKGKKLVYEFLFKDFFPPSSLPEEVRARNTFGFSLNKEVEFKQPFFRVGNLLELFDEALLKSMSIPENEYPALLYGPQEAPPKVRQGNYITNGLKELRSPEYGPVSGILMPKESKGLFNFEEKERLYWERTSDK